MTYKNVLECLENNRETFEDKEYFDEIFNQLTKRQKIVELEELFGFNIPHSTMYPHYINLKYNGNEAIMFAKEGKSISWSDDGRQPSNEWLYIISFSTGAYYFGDHYPEETFNEFFNELKEYNPKYSDTRNRTLYFSPENAITIHAVFEDIVKKYAELSAEEYKKQKAEKLRKELEELENE